MQLTVFASLVEDVNSGWIRIPEGQINQRSVVKVKNLDTGKTVLCEALSIDRNFIKHYNEQISTFDIENPAESIVINEWYRIKLGIKQTHSSHNFDISTKKRCFGKTRASLQHPQIVVRVAIYLGIISVIIGFIGLMLGILSLCH